MASETTNSDRVELQKVQESAPEDAVIEKNPGNDEIERLAHELYLERGGIHGHDVDDWLPADRELNEAELLQQLRMWEKRRRESRPAGLCVISEVEREPHALQKTAPAARTTRVRP